MQRTAIAIVFAIFSLSHQAILAGEPTRLTIGAIRWDAWFNGNTYEDNLAPQRWRYRLPFYASALTDGRVKVRSDNQDVMDQEIAFASKAQLDYWAFCYYHPKSWVGADNYNYGWKLYLSSKQKANLNFCLLLQGPHLGPYSEWPETLRTLVRFLQEPTYQKVLDGRPLIFMYSVLEMRTWAGSSEAAKQRLDDLRKECQKSGIKNPYLVAQVYRTQDGIAAVDALGFDAISAYSLPGGSGDREFVFGQLAKANTTSGMLARLPENPLFPS